MQKAVTQREQSEYNSSAWRW